MTKREKIRNMKAVLRLLKDGHSDFICHALCRVTGRKYDLTFHCIDELAVYGLKPTRKRVFSHDAWWSNTNRGMGYRKRAVQAAIKRLQK